MLISLAILYFKDIFSCAGQLIYIFNQTKIVDYSQILENV